MINAVSEIHINVIVGLQIKLLLELFAKRAIHGKVIGAVVNIIDKRCIVQDRMFIALDPYCLSIIARDKAFRKHKFSQYSLETSWGLLAP